MFIPYQTRAINPGRGYCGTGTEYQTWTPGHGHEKINVEMLILIDSVRVLKLIKMYAEHSLGPIDLDVGTSVGLRA